MPTRCSTLCPHPGHRHFTNAAGPPKAWKPWGEMPQQPAPHWKTTSQIHPESSMSGLTLNPLLHLHYHSQWKPCLPRPHLPGAVSSRENAIRMLWRASSSDSQVWPEDPGLALRGRLGRSIPLFFHSYSLRVRHALRPDVVLQPLPAPPHFLSQAISLLAKSFLYF